MADPPVKITEYGRHDPRRWQWPFILSLVWRGYVVVWHGDLTPTGQSLGPWTPALLNGLASHDVRVRMTTVDGEQRPGEIWLKRRLNGWVYLVIAGAIALLQVFT